MFPSFHIFYQIFLIFSNQELNLLYQFWIHTELVVKWECVVDDDGDVDDTDDIDDDDGGCIQSILYIEFEYDITNLLKVQSIRFLFTSNRLRGMDFDLPLKGWEHWILISLSKVESIGFWFTSQRLRALDFDLPLIGWEHWIFIYL